jgi:hypothetical protein
MSSIMLKMLREKCGMGSWAVMYPVETAISSHRRLFVGLYLKKLSQRSEGKSMYIQHADEYIDNIKIRRQSIEYGSTLMDTYCPLPLRRRFVERAFERSF